MFFAGHAESCRLGASANAAAAESRTNASARCPMRQPEAAAGCNVKCCEISRRLHASCRIFGRQYFLSIASRIDASLLSEKLASAPIFPIDAALFLVMGITL